MHLLRHKGQTEPGTVRWVNQKSLDEWRSNVVAHLNSTTPSDRGRFRYETAQHTRPDAEAPTEGEYRIGDTAVLERPKPNKPEEPRIVVDQMVKSTVDQWLMWRRTHPDLFWRKVAEAKDLVPELAHLTVEQAADQIVALCRKIEEGEAQRTYGLLKIGGGWKGPVLRS